MRGRSDATEEEKEWDSAKGWGNKDWSLRKGCGRKICVKIEGKKTAGGQTWCSGGIGSLTINGSWVNEPNNPYLARRGVELRSHKSLDGICRVYRNRRYIHIEGERLPIFHKRRRGKEWLWGDENSKLRRRREFGWECLTDQGRVKPHHNTSHHPRRSRPAT